MRSFLFTASVLVFVAALLLVPLSAAAQLADAGKLLPSVSATDIGWDTTLGPVAVDGDLAIVGTGVVYGYVFIFKRTSAGWAEVAAIQDPSEMLGVDGYFSAFGAAVAISGNTVVVGNPNHSEGLNTNSTCCVDNNIGAIHTYELEHNEWVQTAFFTLPVQPFRDKTFGRAVAIQGDTIFASTPNGWGGDNQSWHGIIARYTRSGGQWGHAETFPGPNTQPYDEFGAQLAVHGNTLLTTADIAPGDNALNNHLVHVYENIGSSWIYSGDLTPSSTTDDSGYGIGLTVHENTALTGAPFTKGKGNKTGAGAVHVFYRGLNGVWVEAQATLTASDPSTNAGFGRTVALHGNTLLVGSPSDSSSFSSGGSAYYFERSGTSFVEIAKLVPGDNAAGDRFGRSLAVDGGNAFIVAPEDDDAGLDDGSIYVYDCGEDTDEDGLCDDWETLGIPYYDSAGSLQRYLLDIDDNGLTDADPMHKDLFVEIDSMSGRTYPATAKAMVETAFALAPVSNPNLDIGIDVHIQIDDTTLPFEDTVITDTGWPLNVEGLRATYFGTLAEWSDPDAEAMLNAKAKAFRYSINANRGEFLNDDFTTTPFGGIGELPGDDSVLYGAGMDDESLAAVFMHELGHNLGLKHGGGDHINGKPNYPSIMNYALAYREDWNSSFWTLDYCNEKLPVLDEASLDETITIFSSTSGYYEEYEMPFYAEVPDGSACWNPSEFNTFVVEYLSLDGQVLADFNLDCDVDDSGVVVDLNNLPSSGLPGTVTATPNQKLRGFNDWENIGFLVSDGGGSYKGALPPEELTDDQRQFMRDNFPIPVPEPGSVAQMGTGIAYLLGLRSCRKRRNWRVTFRFDGTNATDVNYEDYH